MKYGIDYLIYFNFNQANIGGGAGGAGGRSSPPTPPPPPNTHRHTHTFQNAPPPLTKFRSNFVGCLDDFS